MFCTYSPLVALPSMTQPSLAAPNERPLEAASSIVYDILWRRLEHEIGLLQHSLTQI